MPQPSIGRIVHYKLTAENATQIIQSRAMSNAKGNTVMTGDVFPAIIVRVWGDDTINLRVILDGTEDVWVTSVHEGEEPGFWSWPPRV